jgi:hypothetical protein
MSYDPATDHWNPLPGSNLIDGGGLRQSVAVWTGSELMVWRAHNTSSTITNNGAAYHPDSGTWTALPAAPVTLQTGSAWAWTGSQLVIWDGAAGAFYSPATNHWTTMAGGSPIGTDLLNGAAGVWTGRYVFFAGGSIVGSNNHNQAVAALYDPAKNIWYPLPVPPPMPTPGGTARSATARQSPDILWTGSSVVVLAGYDDAYQATVPNGVIWTP